MSRGSTKITRFRLNCGDSFVEEEIMRWIHIAALRNVQELEIITECCDWLYRVKLPNRLVSCESLRVLRLTRPWCYLELPNYLKFKQLRSLYLELVEFTDDDLTRNLFSECSFLQELSLINCIGRRTEILDISSSSLKFLTITSYYCYNDEIYGFANCEIRISCPNLISFTYMGGVAKNYCLDNISSLDYMCIDIFPEDHYEWSNEKVGHVVCKILEQVENIRVLKLLGEVMKYLIRVIEDLQCFSTTFRRLKFLNLSLKIDRRCYQAMFLLLKHCPNLESLTLVNEFNKYAEQSELWQLHDEENACWGESHLKSVRLIKFKGEEHELRFVKFMLKNALVLEEFIIIWSESVKKSLATKTKRKILKFPKASSLVEVKIVPR